MILNVSKINLLRWALLCLILILNHTALAANKNPASILVLGDSLSAAYGIDTHEGWVTLLQQKLTQHKAAYQVINASVSGDTTRMGLNRLEPALKTHQPRIVIIALGANDGLRGLTFSEMESSLKAMIELCRTYQAQVLLSGVRLPPNYGAAYNQRFAAVYRKLATHYDIPLVPKMLDQVAERRELIQEDGLHPKAKAQPLILNNIWPKLASMLQPD